MGITGDRYVGTYEAHTVELVRNNWDKTLRLRIDGHEVDCASRVLLHAITLTGTLEHRGVQHTVVAKSVTRFPSTKDTIEIDGQALTLAKTK
ncbi:MAG: hypothetical protein ACR2PL_24800 [Dehalococcoidia bacterium]